MLYLKGQGFLTMDQGGYAAGAHDPGSRGVKHFKDSFGGSPVEESNYFSPLGYVYRSLVQRRISKKALSTCGASTQYGKVTAWPFCSPRRNITVDPGLSSERIAGVRLL
jgi:hypothetical protein